MAPIGNKVRKLPAFRRFELVQKLRKMRLLLSLLLLSVLLFGAVSVLWSTRRLHWFVCGVEPIAGFEDETLLQTVLFAA